MSEIVIVVDDVVHTLSKEADYALLLDGNPLPWALISDGKTAPRIEVVFSAETHPNVASCTTLQALMHAFILRLIFGLPVRAKYAVNWHYFACGDTRPSADTPDVQVLPTSTKDVAEFDFHSAIIAAGDRGDQKSL